MLPTILIKERMTFVFAKFAAERLFLDESGRDHGRAPPGILHFARRCALVLSFSAPHEPLDRATAIEKMERSQKVSFR